MEANNTNLLYRMFFSDETTQNTNAVAADTFRIEPTKIAGNEIVSNAIASNEIVSNEPLQILNTDTLYGGAEESEEVKIKVNLDSKSLKVFTRFFILYFIFFITVILAVLTMHSTDILRLIYNEDYPDNNFNDIQTDFKTKWKKLILYTLIFVVIVFLYNILALLLVFGYIWVTQSEGDAVKAFNKTIQFIFNIKYKNKVISVSYYIKILIAVLFGLFVFFALYFLCNKSYISSMYFGNFAKIDGEDGVDTEELQQPQKFIYYYAFITILIMLTVLMVINSDPGFDVGDWDFFSFIIITIFIIILLIFSGLTIKNMLYRDVKKLCLCLFLGVALPILIFVFNDKIKQSITTL